MKMSPLNKPFKPLIFSVCLLILTGLFLTGCGTASKKPIPEKKTTVNPGAAASKEASVTQRVRLYFADEQKQKLVPESRVIRVPKAKLPAQVVKELIRGPQVSGSVSTIPPETRLMSISVSNMIARVNLSQELVTQHEGGTVAQRITVYSIVDSLVRLSGITRVQILIEGKTARSPLGDIDLSKPLLPDYSLIKTETPKVIVKQVPVPVKKPLEVNESQKQKAGSGQEDSGDRLQQQNPNGQNQPGQESNRQNGQNSQQEPADQTTDNMESSQETMLWSPPD